MICSVCGSTLKENEQFCPYCKTPRGYVSKKAEEDLKKTLDFIEKKYLATLNYNQNNDNYSEKSLVEQIENIQEKLNELILGQQSQSDETTRRFVEMEEMIQQRLPLRDSVIANRQQGEKMTTSKAVEFFLDEFKIPEVNFAAFKIRNSVEKQLIEFYKYEYFYFHDSRNFLMVKKIIDVDGKKQPIKFKNGHSRFLKATNNDEEIAKSINARIGTLNLFIHASSFNDQKIAEKYPTIDDQVKFLKSLFLDLKKFNLIKE